MHARHLGGPVADEGAAAAEHFVQDHADPIKVGAAIERAADGGFGRHVKRAADCRPELRAMSDRPRPEFGDSKIDELDPQLGAGLEAVTEKDVLGLDIAVNDTGGMKDF